MTHALIDAPERLDQERIQEINDIGAGVLDDYQTTPHPAVLIESALYGALSDRVGSSRHSASIEIDGKPPQAQIMGISIAHADRDPDNQTPTAAFVNQRSGTLAIATGTGSRVGVEATVRGFERRAVRERAWRVGLAGASSVVTDALHYTVPKVIQAAQETLQANPSSTTAEGLGVQLVGDAMGDALVYSGKQPLLVFNVQTKEFTWLADNTSTGETGIHRLEPGRHMVLMCAGPESVTGDMSAINDAFLAALKQNPGVAHPTEEAAAQTKATQVAAFIQEALGGSKRDVTVVTAAIHVAGQPVARGVAPAPQASDPEWHDSRSRLRRMTDWGRLATFATMAAAHVFVPAIRDERRRQTYERMKQAGALGKVGRAALIAADIAVGTGLAFTAARLVGHDLTPHIGHEIVAAEHLLGLSGSGHTTIAAQADLHQTAAGAAATESQQSPSAAHNTPAPQQTAPVVNQTPATPQIPDTYTALAHDPHRGGKPSTIYDIDRYLLGEQAKAHGATDAQIAGLQHDDKILDGGVAAFVGDHGNPNNGQAAHNPQTGVNANTTYSVHDLKAYNEKVIESLIPQSAPAQAAPTPQPTSAAAAPPATVTPPAATAAPAAVAAHPATIDRTSQIEKIAIGGAEGAAAATVIAGGWLTFKNLIPWVRRRRSTAAERPAIKRTSAAQTELAALPPKAIPLATSLPRHRNTDPTLPRSADTTDPSMEAVPKMFEVPDPPAPVGPFAPYNVDNAHADVTAAFRAASVDVLPKPEDDPFMRFVNGMGRAEEKPVHGKGKRYKELVKSGVNFSFGTLRVNKAWIKKHPLKTDKPHLLARLGGIFLPSRRKTASQPDPLTALEHSNAAGAEAHEPEVREPELVGAAA